MNTTLCAHDYHVDCPHCNPTFQDVTITATENVTQDVIVVTLHHNGYSALYGARSIVAKTWQEIKEELDLIN